MEFSLYDTDLKFFKVKDRHYVLDVPSSALFEIHPWIKKILIQSIKNPSVDYLDDIKREHNFLDWMDMAGELSYLIDNRFLTIHSSQITPYELKEQKINSITLNICHDCNMTCTYCYQNNGKFGQVPEYMSKEVANKSIEFLFANCVDHTLYLNISGGEPLLNPDLVLEIMQVAREHEEKKEKKLEITITTNGTLLEADLLEQLKYYDVNLIITLDGRPHEHNQMRKMANRRPSYDLIYDKIQLVKESGIKYMVRGILHHFNVQVINEIFESYDKAEFPIINLQPIIAPVDSELALTGKDIQMIKDYYHTMFEKYQYPDSLCHRMCNLNSAVQGIGNMKNRGYFCGAGKNYLSITPSGDIYPCHLLVGYQEFYLGNVAHHSLNEDIRKKFYEPLHVLNRESCKECWARYLCGGGCVGENYLIHKQLTAPYQPRCEINQFVLTDAIQTYCNSLNEDEVLTFVPERRKSGREIYKIG